MKVREWLEGESGAVVGFADAEPDTGQHPAWFISQVTPFQVHVKLGHYNTLVWVTDLATGEPVEGAKVEVVEPMGNETIVYVTTGKSPIVARLITREEIKPDSDIELLIDMRRVHFFDPGDEKTIV